MLYTFLQVVHDSLAALKGHPECLICEKTLWRPGLCPGPHRRGAYSAPPDHPAGGDGDGCPSTKIPSPLLALGPPTLALRASLLASPNPFTKICLSVNQSMISLYHTTTAHGLISLRNMTEKKTDG